MFVDLEHVERSATELLRALIVRPLAQRTSGYTRIKRLPLASSTLRLHTTSRPQIDGHDFGRHSTHHRGCLTCKSHSELTASTCVEANLSDATMTTTRSRSASFASSVSSSSDASDADVQVEVDEINDEAEVLSATQQPLRYRRMQARATAHRNPEEERLRHAVGGGLVTSMKAGPRLEPPRSRKRAYVLCKLAQGCLADSSRNRCRALAMAQQCLVDTSFGEGCPRRWMEGSLRTRTAGKGAVRLTIKEDTCLLYH